MTKNKIAIIGAGTLGTTIADEVSTQLNEHYELVGMMKQSKERMTELKETYYIPIVTKLSELLKTQPDFIVEAASVETVKDYGETILEHGIDFIPLSVGGLADEAVYKKLQKIAKKNNAVLYIPSGAIGGFDFMRKMMLEHTPEVEFNAYHSPNDLKNAPYLKDVKLSETEKEIVFTGSAAEAIEGFPENINVAVATALATVGPMNTRTIIHSEPERNGVTHEIIVKNQAGTVDIHSTKHPTVEDETSSIVALSVISLLKNIAEPVRFF